METKLLHAIISGIIMALAFGVSLVPAMWQIISQEPTFDPTPNNAAIIGIIASVIIILITLLSFKFVRTSEK